MNSAPPAISSAIQDWLLDPADPGPYYLALKELSPQPHPELPAARTAAHHTGPIATILAAMDPDGSWDESKSGYAPKYTGSVWSLINLAQLGASIAEEPRIALACEAYLARALNEGGQFSATGPPSGTADCLQGNMLAALTLLGFQDPRLDAAWDWMARATTGEGVAPMGDKKAERRYYSGQIGPDFQCGANNKESCAWGGVKVLTAFSALDRGSWTPQIEKAVLRGVEFFFSIDPATALYPSGWNEKPSGNWWKFGFPVFYISDLLQLCQALCDLGYRDDPRLGNTLDLIRDKQTKEGWWTLDYSYSGKTWLDFGEKKEPNKWVTIRALKALGAHF